MSSTLFPRPLVDGALSHVEASENQRAIREQLERILESPGFRNSKRYPNLLRLRSSTAFRVRLAFWRPIPGREPGIIPRATRGKEFLKDLKALKFPQVSRGLR